MQCPVSKERARGGILVPRSQTDVNGRLENRFSSLVPPGSRHGIFPLRKEVIHPHVPVGIPCYDLTPITDPALGGSVPFGFGRRLQALPALMV